MARIIFPTSRTTGTEHTHSDGRKFRFDGKRWKSVNTQLEDLQSQVNTTAAAIVAAEKEAGTIISASEAQAAVTAATSTKLESSASFGGDVTGTYSNLQVVNDSHTHDSRYYTEAEINTKLADMATQTWVTSQLANTGISSGTTAQRPTNPAIGTMRVNTQYNILEAYIGGQWINVTTGGTAGLDGSSAALAAPSAAYIKSLTGTNTNGIYWIDLPTVGPTQVYCLMDSSVGNGGGYMLAMKATQSNTFSYSSSYWTSANVLNETTQLNRNNADAKFHVYNYFGATEFVAFFPDLNNGGQTSGFGTGWHWRHTQATANTGITRFSTTQQLSSNPRGESMYVGSGFSNQAGMQWYGFNYNLNTANAARWGFGWNNEADHGSNDVESGIGLARSGNSAGDHIYCCQSTTGVNRSARMEIWVK